MKNITIKDVAEKAGVSVTTASFALNNVSGRVSKNSRRKVIEAAKELSYIPNLNARSLRSKQNNTVMLVYSEYYLKEQNASTSQFIIEFIKLTEENNQSVIIRTTKKWIDIDEAVEEFYSVWHNGQIDGIIFMPAFDEVDERIFEKLYNDYSVNIAVISTMGGNKKYPTVFMDGYIHMRRCMDYIIKKGYKEVYYIAMEYRGDEPQRLKAYRDYIVQNNIAGKILTYKDIYRSKSELWDIVKPIVDNQTEDIAFACWNDVDAINLIELLNLKLKTRKNRIGIMGFDNMRASAHTSPALTTVNYPFDKAAQKALSIISKGEISKQNPPSIEIYGDIVERESL